MGASAQGRVCSGYAGRWTILKSKLRIYDHSEKGGGMKNLKNKLIELQEKLPKGDEIDDLYDIWGVS